MTDPRPLHDALNQPLTPDQFKPADLHLDRREGLKIRWADGHESRYPLAYLRKQCPCATCRDTPPDAGPAKPNAAAAGKGKGGGLSLTILPQNIDQAATFTDAKLVGNYALQIIWADGHSTGIYDFRYLRAICPAESGDCGGPRA